MNGPGLFSVREQWIPQEASELARAVNGQFDLLAVIGISLLLAALVLVMLVLMNRREPEAKAPVVSGSPQGALLFGLVGAVLAVVVFVGGMSVRVDASVAPARARAIAAVGSEDGWRFVYGVDVESDALHVRTGEATRLDLSSTDGVLRFSAPSLRVAETVLPDQPTSVWFRATEPGEFPLRASGVSTAAFDSTSPRVVVHDPVAFDAWLASISNVLDRYPPVEAGHLLVQRNGCLVCHSTDGSPGTAPSFLGLLSRTRTLLDGSVVQADSTYVFESVLEPRAKVVQGFEPVMPSFTGKLGEPEVDAIRQWIASLEQQEEGR